MDFKEQEEKEKSLRPSAAALGRNDFFDGRGETNRYLCQPVLQYSFIKKYTVYYSLKGWGTERQYT